MNILILAKDFAPLNVIAAKRPAAWFNYWIQSGINVRVVTSTPNDGTAQDSDAILRVKPANLSADNLLQKMRRKLRSAIEIWLPFILPSSSRYYAIFKAADGLMTKEKFDFVIATGEPFILFAFASKLSKKHNVPWCADYRDNWSNNPLFNTSGKIHLRILQRFLSSAESKWLKSARMITTAAPGYSSKVAALCSTPEKIFTVLNGHDINFSVKPPAESRTFNLYYSGRLYSFQPIEEFLTTLRDTFPDHSDLRIIFLGLADWPDQVQRVKEAAGELSDRISFRSGLSYGNYIEQLSAAHCMMLLSRENMNWLNAKIFDYIAMKGAICQFYGKDGVLEPILEKHDGIFIANSQEELKHQLLVVYELFKQKAINFERDSAQYARSERAKELLDLLIQNKNEPGVANFSY
jgi:glycosyltransferase involved in cell wall biosynthesis